MSLKIDMMVDHINTTFPHYRTALKPKKVEEYLIMQFSCSKYLARQAVEKLYKYE